MIDNANQNAIGTLVERSTGYAPLVHLPNGYKPEQAAPALAAKIQTLPETPRRSLTSDQGPETRDSKQVRIDTGIEIYFCDPNSPWPRATNENTNGTATPVLPQRHRPRHHHRTRTRPRRRPTQRPTPQTP
jgi:IS30 family transposase